MTDRREVQTDARAVTDRTGRFWGELRAVERLSERRDHGTRAIGEGYGRSDRRRCLHKLITQPRFYLPTMLADGEESRSQSEGLGRIGEGRELRPQSPTGRLRRQLRRRWKILGSTVVTALTTAAVYRVDGFFSKDAIVFALVTAALLVYFLMTIWSDLKLE